MKHCSQSVTIRHSGHSLCTLQLGVTLVELMVSLALGAFLIFGVMKAFLSGRQAYSLQQSLSHIQESGRFAHEFIGFDVRSSGDYGCGTGDAFVSSSTPDDKVSVACAGINALNDADDVRYNFGYAVYGYDNVSATTIAALPYLAPAPIAGTDILVTHPASDVGSLTAGVAGAAVDTLAIQPTTGLARGDFIALSDCANTRILQVKTVSTTTIKVVKDGAVVPAPGDRCIVNIPFDAASTVRRLDTVFYYIGNNTSGVPALYAYSVSDDVSNELIAGVENMQLKYGVDLQAKGAAGYGLVDSYKDASAISDTAWNGWDRDANVVRSVRYYLLIRGEDSVLSDPQTYTFPPTASSATTAADLRLRHIFVNTVGIRVRTNPR